MGCLGQSHHRKNRSQKPFVYIWEEKEEEREEPRSIMMIWAYGRDGFAGTLMRADIALTCFANVCDYEDDGDNER